MKKTITVVGKNGTFIGTIEVKFNDRKEIKTVHQANTHDDIERTVWYHRVYGIIVGQKEMFRSNEFTNEFHVFQELEGVEMAVQGRLDRLANTKVEQTVKEKLSELGYQ